MWVRDNESKRKVDEFQVSSTGHADVKEGDGNKRSRGLGSFFGQRLPQGKKKPFEVSKVTSLPVIDHKQLPQDVANVMKDI